MLEMSLMMGSLLLVLIRPRVKLGDCLSREGWVRCLGEAVEELRRHDIGRIINMNIEIAKAYDSNFTKGIDSD